MTWKSSARPSSTIELIYSQENRPKSVLHVDKDCGTCKLDVQSTKRGQTFLLSSESKVKISLFYSMKSLLKNSSESN